MFQNDISIPTGSEVPEGIGEVRLVKAKGQSISLIVKYITFNWKSYQWQKIISD